MQTQNIPARYANTLLNKLSAHGFCPRSACASSGLCFDFINNDGKNGRSNISCLEYTNLLQYTFKKLKNDLFYITDKSIPSEAFRMMCYCVIGSKNLATVIERSYQFYQIFFKKCSHHIVTKGDIASVSFPNQKDDSKNPVDTATVCRLSLWHRFFSWLIDTPITLNTVKFVGKKPQQANNRKNQRNEFGAKIGYQMDSNALVFSQQFLYYPVVQSAQSLKLFLEKAPYTLLLNTPSRPAPATIDEVKFVINSSGRSPTLDCDQVSTALNISKSTLRRRLKSENISFKQLKDESLLSTAKSFLRDVNIPIDTIASQIGYKHSTTFYRSFKRWTNMTPKEYRDKKQQMNEGLSM